jgi:hypothetical protein
LCAAGSTAFGAVHETRTCIVVSLAQREDEGQPASKAFLAFACGSDALPGARPGGLLENLFALGAAAGAARGWRHTSAEARFELHLLFVSPGKARMRICTTWVCALHMYNPDVGGLITLRLFDSACFGDGVSGIVSSSPPCNAGAAVDSLFVPLSPPWRACLPRGWTLSSARWRSQGGGC